MHSSALLLLCLAAAPAAAAGTPLRALMVEYEAGPARIFQNDGRYGPTGTEYSADDLNQRDNLFVAHRLSLEARLGERHGLILLYAPLDLRTRATLEQDLDFRGTLFPAGTVVDSRYLFDGYRGSYLFRVLDRGRLQWEVGPTLQVRNARVDLGAVDGSGYAKEDDIGLVFAAKTRLVYRTGWRGWMALEGDGFSTFGLISGVRGAIYDVALTLGIPLTPEVDDASAFLRLRWVGGGAEVERRDLYNWGNFGFVVLGLRADLQSVLGGGRAPPASSGRGGGLDVEDGQDGSRSGGRLAATPR